MKTKSTISLLITVVLIIFLAILFIISNTSCFKTKRIDGNHDIKIDTRILNDFSKISSSGEFYVYISADTINEIIIEAESTIIPYIYTELTGQSLIIKNRNNYILKNHEPMKIYIKSKKVNEINLSGSGYIYSDSLNSNYINVGINGSGNVDLGIHASYINANISGSGEIKLFGIAKESDYKISGSGNISSFNLLQDSCYVDISGSGNVYANVTDLLNVKISGSGDIYYKGTPVLKKSISGSGSVNQE